ncbi:hypothetical protein [Paraglaciecola sp. 25GB23A]|uniref:hypothetical protein n=1 Tax=Paraglaciecola sp. 25GB23A TaxID=3156068 RepID=UPI0032AF9366
MNHRVHRVPRTEGTEVKSKATAKASKPQKKHFTTENLSMGMSSVIDRVVLLHYRGILKGAVEH